MIYRFVSLYSAHDDLECSRKMYVTARRGPCLWKQKSFVRKIGGPKCHFYFKRTHHDSRHCRSDSMQGISHWEHNLKVIEWPETAHVSALTHAHSARPRHLKQKEVLSHPRIKFFTDKVILLLHAHSGRRICIENCTVIVLVILNTGSFPCHVCPSTRGLCMYIWYCPRFSAGAAGSYLEQYDLATVGASKSARW